MFDFSRTRRIFFKIYLNGHITASSCKFMSRGRNIIGRTSRRVTVDIDEHLIFFCQELEVAESLLFIEAKLISLLLFHPATLDDFTLADQLHLHGVRSVRYSGILWLLWTAPFQTLFAHSQVLRRFCFVALRCDQFARDKAQVSILLELFLLRNCSLAALIAAGPALRVVRILRNAYALQRRSL